MYANLSNLSLRTFGRNLLNSFTTNNMIRRTITNSIYEKIEIPRTTLPEFFFQSFDRYPNETAVECSLTKKKYTFDDLRIKSRNFNKNIRKKLKLNKGDVIAIILPNMPDFPICLVGAIQAGLIVTTINPSYTAAEIGYQLNDSGAKAIVTLGAFYPIVKEAEKATKKSIPILTVKQEQAEGVPFGALDLNEFIETEIEIEEVSGQSVNDVVLLPYSSGTTGLPKGVELTHHTIIANICQLDCKSLTHLIPRSETHVNVVPAILPMFHTYGITLGLFLNLSKLSKVISVPKFTVDGFIKMLSEHKPNILNLVPHLIQFISSNPLVKSNLFDRTTTILCGGAPLGISDEEKLLKKIRKHINILQGYGLTETSSAVSVSTPKVIEQFGHTGSCGLPIPNTSVKIVSTLNPSVELLGTNEKGELLVKGPQVMKCYHNRPKETKEAFVDGWFRTGDLGYFDERGLLYVTDRLKELIKVKGFQVAPAELEEVLRTHKDVSDAGVIGVPHSVSGEAPLAYVVPRSNSKVDVNDLHKYMAKKVASYKQLKGGIIVVDSLPKTSSGKILKRELKLQYQNSQKK